MQKVVLFSIAALASLAGAAIAQTPEREPAWRKSALAFVPAGYVAGDGYRLTALGKELVENLVPLHRFAEKWAKRS